MNIDVCTKVPGSPCWEPFPPLAKLFLLFCSDFTVLIFPTRLVDLQKPFESRHKVGTYSLLVI